MTLLTLTSTLLTISALFAYINYRLFKLPTTIGIMVISLVFSIALVVAGKLGYTQGIHFAKDLFGQIDFNEALMQGMLAWLLFAGALHVNLGELIDKRLVVGLLASVGVVMSTFIVGIGSWVLLSLLAWRSHLSTACCSARSFRLPILWR